MRAFLHLVLCFSPVGDSFRQRLRMFPALVNCTTIDWFSEWPVEALSSVAKSFLADVEVRDMPGVMHRHGGDASASDLCALLHVAAQT